MIHRALLLVTLCISFTFLSSPALAKANQMQGTITNIINVTSYTYVEVKTKDSTVWAAAPTTQVKVGSKITFSTQMPMQNFHSESIDRTFPLIYFVGKFETNGSATQPSPHTQFSPSQSFIKGIDKVKGGKNIAEIIAERDTLKDKTITIRGKVTRFNAEIMGKNWLHIQDSSARDLTVTTNETTKIGDIVVIEGKVSVDKDFGNNYRYSVILEDARILPNK